MFQQEDGNYYFLLVSPPKVVEKILELAEPRSGETLYDLGAGDGRIVIQAAREYGVMSIGIESHPDLVEYARGKIRDLRLACSAGRYTRHPIRHHCLWIYRLDT